MCEKSRHGKNISAGIILTAAFFLSALCGPGALASQFFFSKAGPYSLSAGDEFQLDVSINSRGASLNALQGKIIFPPDLLELENINTEKSIINLWVEQPAVKNSSAGTLIFSGITPGGFQAADANVFSLFFKARQAGQGEIILQDQQALINDGTGTDSLPSAAALTVNVGNANPGAGAITISEPPDNLPPEDFTPQIVNDPNLFSGQNVLIFNAQDKETGINHYEVKEQKTFSFLGITFNTGDWQMAVSPYLLKDQKLESDIYAKAVDNAGNEKIETIVAVRPVRWYENFIIWSIIILAALIAAAWIAGKKYARKK